MENTAQLLIKPAGQNSTTVALEKNTSLFAGSGANCRIVLAGDDVNSIHCRLWLDHDLALRVQDWNTGKTCLNGQTITEETVLNVGDKLTIGAHEIISVGCGEVEERQAERPSPDQCLALDPDETAFEADPQPVAEFEQQEECSEDAMVDSLADEQDPFNYDLNLDEMEPCVDVEKVPAFSFGSQAADDEEVELLRMEVEQLRFEIAERDSQLRMMNDRQTSMENDENSLEAEEDTIRLVNRLEDLLEELQSSDQRVRGLEELLRASDEATRAEQEERHQLESWVTEIEQRVSQREDETAAEIERFQNQVTDLKAQLQQSQVQLKKALSARSESASESDQPLIRDLRDQLEQLHQKLEMASAENERLREEMSQDDRHSAADYQKLEQSYLELQVSTSRERAELAREREKVIRMKDEFEKKFNSNIDADDANSRIRAMRQHLQDVHEQEREERKNRSLGGRISRLLSGSSSK